MQSAAIESADSRYRIRRYTLSVTIVRIFLTIKTALVPEGVIHAQPPSCVVTHPETCEDSPHDRRHCWSIRIVRCSVVQGPESASAANRQWGSRSHRGDSATGEWTTGSVRRVDDGRAPLCHPRDSTHQRASEVESSVATVPASYSQLLASEYQHWHRHARRAALPAMAREAR